MTTAIASMLATIATIVIIGVLAMLLSDDPYDHVDLETLYPVSYQACLDRGECK